MAGVCNERKVLRCGLFDNLHSTIGILTCSVVGTRKATALYAYNSD